MKSTYAAKTAVPVDRTIGEIRELVRKFGGSSFATIEDNGVAVIAFKLDTKAVRMMISLPRADDSTKAAQNRTAQIHRSKWRTLLLVVKAKMEAIASGIETFEQAFLPYVVLRNGQVLGDRIIPQIEKERESTGNFLIGFN